MIERFLHTLDYANIIYITVWMYKICGVGMSEKAEKVFVSSMFLKLSIYPKVLAHS